MALKISESGRVELPEGIGEDKTSELELLMEESGELLNIINSNNECVAVNDRWVELTGYTKDEMLGTHVRNYFTDETIEKGRYVTFQLWNGERDASDFWRGEIVTKDGSTIPIETKFALLPPTSDGDYNGLVEISRDIRQRRRREEKLNVLTRVLRHNLRNKMGVIMGQAERVKDTDDPETQEAAELIEGTADELIQTGSKVRKVQEEIQDNPGERYRTEITGQIERVVETARETHPEHRVTVDVPVRPVSANVPSSFTIALEELVENAIEHRPEDTIAAVHVAVEPGQETVETVIKDTCPPLPAQELDVLEAGKETALSHSSGLGLWLANWIVETAGGELAFDRREDGPDGNRVTVTLDRV